MVGGDGMVDERVGDSSQMADKKKIQEWMAQRCVDCAVCKYARRKQKGFIYQFVKFESRICPFCWAYEKIYGKKAYEPREQ